MIRYLISYIKTVLEEGCINNDIEKSLLFYSLLSTQSVWRGETVWLLDHEEVPGVLLHISWQDRLIELIRELNPNCQLILTTHSPNIFANGWEDKIVFIPDLVVK